MRLPLLLTASLILAPGAASAEAPGFPSREVEEAWRKSGAFRGWLGPRKAGGMWVYTRKLEELDPARAVPAFQPPWKDGMLATLPFPTRPFGLSIQAANGITD